MSKLFSSIMVISIVLFFTACGGGGPKIVIPSYTAPKEASKLSKIETKDEFISDGAYLALFINPDVTGSKETNSKLEPMLINSVKAKLTETNFITLDPMEDGVTLSMKVANYEFKSSGNKVSSSLEVTFILSRGTDEFLVKSYKSRKNRQSKDKTKLPTENELTSESVKKVVKYFILDISPTKTSQLREFKAMPDGLDHVTAYASQRNYKKAIKTMNRFKGKKDLNYHYNLAVLYEAEASTTENLNLLEKASEHYDAALAMGGVKDKLIVSASGRFDKFYDLLNRTKMQDKANQALRDDRDAMGGSSDSEYE